MRRFWLSLAVVALIAQGQEDARAGRVRELIELTGALDRIAPAFDAAFERAGKLASAAEIEQAKKEFGRDQILAVVVPLYAKYFDDETLDATLTFLRSPAGKKYLVSAERAYLDATLAAAASVEGVVRKDGLDRATKRRAAERQCKEYFDCAMLWRTVRKRFPEKIEDLEGPLTERDKVPFVKIEPDPWGGKYVLRPDANGRPTVVCLGPDGVEDTEDDIRYPEER